MGFFSDLFKKKEKPARVAPPANMSWRVTTVTPETPSSVSFEVDGTLNFKAGQFVLLRPNAQLPWRAYSFSRAPGRPLRLTVKRVEGGAVSTHVTQQLKAGDTLEVKGPYGQFVVPEGAKQLLFIAGGSGITPFLSILQEHESRGWPVPVLLLDFNRTQTEQILRAELDALISSSGGKLEVVHVLDDAADGHKGPCSQELLGKLLEGRATPDLVGMCGPQPMMDLARQTVLGKYGPVTILEEKFSMAHEGNGSGASFTVEFVQGGKSQSFEVKDGEHVLAAARKQGVNLSAGCEMGACGVCRVRLLDGQIQVPDDACLSDSEKADGYALVCVGQAKSNCRIEPAP